MHCGTGQTFLYRTGKRSVDHRTQVVRFLDPDPATSEMDRTGITKLPQDPGDHFTGGSQFGRDSFMCSVNGTHLAPALLQQPLGKAVIDACKRDLFDDLQ